MRRPSALLAALWLILATLATAPATAQDRAGQFDHYILALTWMPAFCAFDGDERGDPRCAAGRRAGWMVHGLWPQHQGGTWPEYCQTAQRNPSRTETTAQADLFGTSGAAWHQWNKHGRCTGLSAAGYYALTRQAMAGLSLPALFARVDRPLRVAPDVIEAAFIEANPELDPAMLVTTCRRDTLVELRLCLSRDLEPRACDDEVRSCRLRAADLLPLR
jgi:ribonuclease T2